MKHIPLVSIVMPVRNAMPWLTEALGSIQTQTYWNWELLAVDDCSDDGSFEALLSVQSQDSRVQVLRVKERTSNVARLLNFGLSHIGGEYIMRHDMTPTTIPCLTV